MGSRMTTPETPKPLTEKERKDRLEELGITEEDIAETAYYWPWDTRGTLGQND